MYKKDDIIMYKKDVCKITNIKNEYGIEYYVLSPIDDDSLSISIPVEKEKYFLRNIINKNEAEQIINSIPDIETIKNINDKYIENEYKELISNPTYSNLIKIIKSTYLRNKSRIDSKKKTSDKDIKYFNLAEKYLYNELSIALNMSFEEVKNYIINRVQEMTK